MGPSSQCHGRLRSRTSRSRCCAPSRPSSSGGPPTTMPRKGIVTHVQPPAESVARAEDNALPGAVVFPHYEQNVEDAPRGRRQNRGDDGARRQQRQRQLVGPRAGSRRSRASSIERLVTRSTPAISMTPWKRSMGSRWPVIDGSLLLNVLTDERDPLSFDLTEWGLVSGRGAQHQCSRTARGPLASNAPCFYWPNTSSGRRGRAPDPRNSP